MRAHHERFLLLVIIALLLNLLLQIQAIRRHHHDPPAAPKQQMMLPHAASTPTQSVYGAIADGATMKYADFVQKTGGRIGSLLNFANPDTVTRHGDHFIITCPAPASAGANGRQMSVDTVIEFDLDPNSSDIHMVNIQGVSVQWHSLPAMRLAEVTLTAGANGETNINGELEVGFFMPYISFTQTLDKNGDPV